MSGDVNILLVGTGPMAIAYGRVLNAMRVAWTAVGRGVETAQKFESECGVRPTLGGLDHYLARNSIAAGTYAIVALPVLLLANATTRLAEASVERILVEKPAGVTVAEIEATEKAAARTKAKAFVAYNRRFYASVAAARDMISEDGGATSFHFEFTELDSRKRLENIDAEVLKNWFLANSTHVVDLAFYLGGEPVMTQGLTAGTLPWHPAGAVFAGHGRTKAGTLFSWHADWLSGGRWGVDVRTARRRILLQPLEELAIQEKSSFTVSRLPIDDELDRKFKPGLYRQVEAFLSADPAALGLPTLSDHATRARRWFSAICPDETRDGTASPALVGVS